MTYGLKTRIGRSLSWKVLLCALALTACATSGEQAQPEGADGEVRVHVRNDAFWDANIYLLQGGSRRRLGTVSGNGTQTFVLPRHLTFGLSDIRFAVDWIGRRDGVASETVVAQPGDQIELIIR